MGEKTKYQIHKDAVWDFLLEHCDITEGGSMFVKFHTSGRADFEKRIRARMNGYSRPDLRTLETTEDKKKRQERTREAHQKRKEQKRQKEKERRRLIREVGKRNTRRANLEKMKRKVLFWTILL